MRPEKAQKLEPEISRAQKLARLRRNTYLASNRRRASTQPVKITAPTQRTDNPYDKNTRSSKKLTDEKAFAVNAEAILARTIQEVKEDEKNRLSNTIFKKLLEYVYGKADIIDTILTSFSYITMSITTGWNTIAPFLMITLNSLPWVSVVVNVINGLFRAVRSFALKSILRDSHVATKGTYAKRVLLTSLGLASICIGLASMFTIAASIPLTIACAAIDAVNNIIPLISTIYRWLSSPKNTPEEIEARKQVRARISGKLEYTVLSGLTLAGTIMLFTPFPPVMFAGIALLFFTSVYSALDRCNINPFRRARDAIKNRIQGKADAKKEELKDKVELVKANAVNLEPENNPEVVVNEAVVAPIASNDAPNANVDAVENEAVAADNEALNVNAESAIEPNEARNEEEKLPCKKFKPMLSNPYTQYYSGLLFNSKTTETENALCSKNIILPSIKL